MIPRYKGSVAEWPFEDGFIQQLNWLTLERSLTLCAAVTSILSTHRLLFSNAICFSQWMRAGECGVAQSVRVEKTDVNISVNPSDPFVDVFSLCRSIIDGESVYPLTIDIFGSGTILTDRGDAIVDDLVWLRATTLDIFSISVVTQSDVWLPFSLRGDPQHDIHRLNADRLVNALQEVQQQTGFKLEEGIESHYSVIKGFYLDNIHYADGTVADVS